MKKCDVLLRPLRGEDDIATIARLLYLTDPYIYPAISADPADPFWTRLVSLCLAEEGNLFSASHFCVATVHEKICALSCVIPCGRRLTFSERLPLTAEERVRLSPANDGYFLPLLEESEGMEGYNLVNLCVDPACRGAGVGRALMELFIREYGDARLHLDVVADNTAAVALYKSCGFEITREYGGFSGADTPILCYHMERMGRKI